MTSRRQFAHAHQCQACGSVVHGWAISLKALTVGVIVCPRCESPGAINLQILTTEEARSKSWLETKSDTWKPSLR